MQRIEKWIFWLTFIVGVFAFTILLAFNYQQAQADSVIFVDLLGNISKTGKPNSQLAVMTQDFLFNKEGYLTLKAENLNSLRFLIPIYDDVNFFKFHFYLILYLISPLCIFLPANIVLSLIISAAFMGLIFALYFYLRSKNVFWWKSALFCLFVTSFPAWNMAIQGQLYPDRFFMVFGFIFHLLLSRRESSFWKIVLVSILSSIIVEKTAIMVGLIEIAYFILYKRDKKILVLGLCSLLFGVLTVKFYLNNIYYSSFFSWQSITIGSQILQINLVKFLLVNSPLLLLSLLEPRAFLIALGTMLPNTFGNIGGAEKIGWLTHYHSMYFPVLVWAASRGYIKLVTSKSKRVRVLLSISLLMLCVLNYKDLKNSSLNLAKNYTSYFVRKLGKGVYPNNQIKKVVPEGVKVSCPESYFVKLNENRTLYYFPMGIDEVDYVVLHTDSEGKKYFGYVSYLGDDNAKKADEYLLKRMERYGYDIDNPTIVDNTVIFKRN